MLTSNYYTLCAALAMLATNSSYAFGTPSSNKLVTKRRDGVITRIAEVAANPSYTLISLIPQKIGTLETHYVSILFGTNSGAESILDYNINTIPSISYTIGGGTLEYDEINKKYIVTHRYVLNNTTANDITINEFGIFGSANIGSRYNLLLYRGVIENGFTIQANETVNFDLTLTYDLPVDFEQYNE